MELRYLHFNLGDQDFGFRIESISEVIALPEVSSIPQKAPALLGIIVLREKVIPVVDLRLRFAIQPTLTYDTSIVICPLAKGLVGFVVDAIHSVVTRDEGDVLEMPSAPDDEAAISRVVSNLVNVSGKVHIIIDPQAVMGVSELDFSKFNQQVRPQPKKTA